MFGEDGSQGSVGDVLDGALLRSLDRMSCGALLIDESGLVLEANAHAGRVLLSHGQPGELTGATGRNVLKRLLHQAGSRFRIDTEDWITIPTRDGALLVLHAIPATRGHLKGLHTVLVLVDLNHRPSPRPGVLQRLFDLTPAEARLAIGIGSGKTLAEIAAETGLSSATLRTQLSSVFLKTQTRRQPELVALLARVAILP